MSASAPEVCDPVATAPDARPKEAARTARPSPDPASAVSPPDLTSVPPVDLATELLGAGRLLIVLGVTREGRRFRPSDWAERLASVMSQYRPGKGGKAAAKPSQLGYSPFVVPSEQGGDKCVIVDPRLRDIEPLAWAFVLHFARDNGLRTDTR